MAETWEPIEGAHGHFASSAGRILGRQGRPMTLCRNQQGYLIVSLFIGGKQINRQVHRLVAQAFIPNPENLSVVKHIDRNRENNTVENLEWEAKAERIANPAVNNLLSDLAEIKP